MSTVKIEGLEALKKELKKLGEKKAKNIIVSALNSGAREIANKAKTNVPRDTGDLKKSIGVSKRRTPKTFVRFSVGPRPNLIVTEKKKKRTINKGNYALNVEYGTQFQQAQPFMRNTFDQLGRNVTEAITKQIAKRIAEEYK